MDHDVTPDTPITVEEKRLALEQVLTASAFARSTQLRAFLKHVCEREIDGHAGDLTESQLAQDVLHRSVENAAIGDSAVRNRAYELRQRLEKYYSTENPNPALRIELPKGSYIPVWVRSPQSPSSDQELPSPAPSAIVTDARSFPWLWAAAVLCALAAGWLLRTWTAPQAPGNLREAWGSMANRGNTVVVSVATNLHMLVRPFIADGRRHEAPPELYALYQEQHLLPPGEKLFMHPALYSVPIGELNGIATLASRFSTFGVSFQILPESEAPLTALRDRDAILVGSPMNSRGARQALENAPLTMDFNRNEDFGIFDRRSSTPTTPVFTPRTGSSSTPSIHYGLITVSNRPDAGGTSRRLVVISGTSSAAAQAGAEYYASPDRMAEQLERFRAAGPTVWPKSYQILLRIRSSNVRLLSYEYVRHTVIEP